MLLYFKSIYLLQQKGSYYIKKIVWIRTLWQTLANIFFKSKILWLSNLCVRIYMFGRMTGVKWLTQWSTYLTPHWPEFTWSFSAENNTAWKAAFPSIFLHFRSSEIRVSHVLCLKEWIIYFSQRILRLFLGKFFAYRPGNIIRIGRRLSSVATLVSPHMIWTW